MSYRTFKGIMSDTSSFPVTGEVCLGDDVVTFRPDSADAAASQVAFNATDVRRVTAQRIGPRADRGPFFELTFYLREPGRFYTFGNLDVSHLDEVKDFLKRSYGAEVQEREISASGWNWGLLHVD